MIKIISVGKIKERYLMEGILEYLKRLTLYSKVEILEVLDEKAPLSLSLKDIENIKSKEGLKILSKIKSDDFVILLDLKGKDLDSLELAQKIEQLQVNFSSNIIFVIGGSLGNGKNIQDRANFLLSFGNKTFPHQMMRLFLIEQIYRSFKIIKKEIYHK